MTIINNTSLLHFCTSATRKRLGLGILSVVSAVSLLSNTAFAADQKTEASPSQSVSSSASQVASPKRADLKQEATSPEARKMADWIVDSANNQSLPFVIIDKKDAKVFVFHPNGVLRGAAPALLGLTIGDDSVPGIGNRKLSTITVDERTTPAGRFVSDLGKNVHGGDIVWVDYDNAVSLHPVITSNAEERRAERLATPGPEDNRISYGCINVPVDFFKKVVGPAFKKTRGIVYVLPETRSHQEVFNSYDVDERVKFASAQ